MTSIGKAVEEYLAMRRALGFKLRLAAGMLRDFASYLEHEGASCITTELALRWAKPRLLTSSVPRSLPPSRRAAEPPSRWPRCRTS